jgi:putative heme iron utilization protein
MAAKQEPESRDFNTEARFLIENAKTATLATAENGIPHAALVTVAVRQLRPILLLSQLAIHTRQLQANPACSLLLVGEASGPNPQTTPRLCLTGVAARTESKAARTIFLASHPYANLYVDFADFAFWEIDVTSAYYVGGFGAARQLEVTNLAGNP